VPPAIKGLAIGVLTLTIANMMTPIGSSDDARAGNSLPIEMMGFTPSRAASVVLAARADECDSAHPEFADFLGTARKVVATDAELVRRHFDRPISLAKLAETAPKFIGEVRSAVNAQPEKHVCAFSPREVDELVGNLSACLWLVFLPDASAELLSRLAHHGQFDARLDYWPTLWHSNERFEIGLPEYPLTLIAMTAMVNNSASGAMD